MTLKEKRIWDLVHTWCNEQQFEIPDINKRVLMDRIAGLEEEPIGEEEEEVRREIMQNTELIKSDWSIRACFEQLRRERNSDTYWFEPIILTIDQQEEICKMVDQFYVRK